MDYAVKINAVELEITELKNQLNEAIRNGEREKELAIRYQITAKENQLTALLQLNNQLAQPDKQSSIKKKVVIFDDSLEDEVDATLVTPTTISINEEFFNSLTFRSRFLYESDHSGKKLVKVNSFDDVKEGGYYFLQSRRDNFHGFAEAEASVQTHDVIDAIVKGKVTNGDDADSNIDLGVFKDGDIEFEYNIQPPKDFKLNPKEFKFPVRPDGVIFNGSNILLLECKHNLRLKDVSKFQNKLNVLKNYSTESWFLKERKPKFPNGANLCGAMCSVTPLSKSIKSALQGNNHRGIVFLVRKGLQYITCK